MNHTIIGRYLFKRTIVNNLYQYKYINKTINKGIGAGGANTNKNGLAFEEKVSDLIEPYTEKFNLDDDGFISFKFIGHNRNYKLLKGKDLEKYMSQHKLFDVNVNRLSGCKCPDQAYYCPETKTLNIVEIKHQQCGGSVNQKLSGTPQYIINYQRQYPMCKVKYMYVFSDWFFNNSKPELELLDEHNIPYYNTSLENINKLIKNICN
jgi:hypothetical protein